MRRKDSSRNDHGNKTRVWRNPDAFKQATQLFEDPPVPIPDIPQDPRHYLTAEEKKFLCHMIRRREGHLKESSLIITLSSRDGNANVSVTVAKNRQTHQEPLAPAPPLMLQVEQQKQEASTSTERYCHVPARRWDLPYPIPLDGEEGITEEDHLRRYLHFLDEGETVTVRETIDPKTGQVVRRRWLDFNIYIRNTNGEVDCLNWVS